MENLSRNISKYTDIFLQYGGLACVAGLGLYVMHASRHLLMLVRMTSHTRLLLLLLLLVAHSLLLHANMLSLSVCLSACLSGCHCRRYYERSNRNR